MCIDTWIAIGKALPSKSQKPKRHFARETDADRNS